MSMKTFFQWLEATLQRNPNTRSRELAQLVDSIAMGINMIMDAHEEGGPNNPDFVRKLGQLGTEAEMLERYISWGDPEWEPDPLFAADYERRRPNKNQNRLEKVVYGRILKNVIPLRLQNFYYQHLGQILSPRTTSISHDQAHHVNELFQRLIRYNQPSLPHDNMPNPFISNDDDDDGNWGEEEE